MSQSGLRVELLGWPRLVLPDGRTHPLERHDAALLALLALQGPLPRNRVVGLLWPDVPLKTGQGNLRQRLFRLRKLAGAPVAVVEEPTLALVDGLATDLHDAVPADMRLLGALDYADSGELGDWIDAARRRWQEESRRRLAERAAALESAGRLDDALEAAERLAGDDAGDEEAHRRVMRLHHLRGDRAAALAAFERGRESLARGSGTRPDAETLELAGRIQRGAASPAAADASSPVAVLRPPRLVGREEASSRMREAWAARRIVLLRGDAGIGKTRLAVDFAALRDADVPRCRAHAGDAGQPYALAARLLRTLLARFGTPSEPAALAAFAHLLPELGTAPRGAFDPARLTDAMACWPALGLRALVADDLHLADDASIDWLFAWADPRSPTRPLLLATAQTGAMPAALRDALGTRPADDLCAITLDALPVAAMTELLESFAIPGLACDAWAEALAQQTQRNTLFVLEALRAELMRGPLAGRLPDPSLAAPTSIDDLLQRRLRQLPPAALQLARVAALVGPDDWSPALAARVQGIPLLDVADAWRSLEQAQVIRGNGFAHDLILDAVIRSMPDAIAVRLHREIADALPPDRTPPARLAHHWQRAGEPARAAEAYDAAARVADALARPREAASFRQRAADCRRVTPA